MKIELKYEHVHKNISYKRLVRLQFLNFSFSYKIPDYRIGSTVKILASGLCSASVVTFFRSFHSTNISFRTSSVFRYHTFQVRTNFYDNFNLSSRFTFESFYLFIWLKTRENSLRSLYNNFWNKKIKKSRTFELKIQLITSKNREWRRRKVLLLCR